MFVGANLCVRPINQCVRPINQCVRPINQCVRPINSNPLRVNSIIAIWNLGLKIYISIKKLPTFAQLYLASIGAALEVNF